MSTHPNTYRHPARLTDLEARAFALECLHDHAGFILWPESIWWHAGGPKSRKEEIVALIARIQSEKSIQADRPKARRRQSEKDMIG